MNTLTIIKGTTYQDTLRWASSNIVLKSCGISSSVPVVVRCPNHELIDGWYVNIENNPYIDSTTYYAIHVVDSNVFTIPTLNGSSFRECISQVKYHMPMDLSNTTAVMNIKDSTTGNILFTLSSANSDITIDSNASVFTRVISANITSNLSANTYTYNMLAINGSIINEIDSGNITIQVT